MLVPGLNECVCHTNSSLFYQQFVNKHNRNNFKKTLFNKETVEQHSHFSIEDEWITKAKNEINSMDLDYIYWIVQDSSNPTKFHQTVCYVIIYFRVINNTGKAEYL